MKNILNELTPGELFTLLSKKKTIPDIKTDFDKASPAELMKLESEGYVSQIKVKDPYNVEVHKLSKNDEVQGKIEGLKLFIDSLSPETREMLIESVLSKMGPTPTFEEILTIKLLRGDKEEPRENLSNDDCTPGELITSLYGRQF